ncbi:ABC transporter permease [Patulibacter defluvii]|uniref:ABC transporter permease n=1 Tax=Patulibacter defluvii TaxID=3095358 RepID=UPI002A74B929|nr:ABC transporter permease [Patulibacter sp. DM4]
MSGRRLAAFVARRLLALVLLLVLLSFAVYALMDLAPGSPEQVLLGTRPAKPELVASLRHQFHLDLPFLERYGRWLVDAVQLDLGTSVRSGRTVTAMIGDRIGVTAFLAGYGFVVAVGVGVPLGIVAAVRRRTTADRAIVGLTVVGVSAPAFVTGVVLLYLFAVTLGWFPSYGPGSGVADRFWHLTLPALALALTGLALITKITRTAMAEALEQDYVGFALARGVPLREVVVRHALRNALIPILTAAGAVLTVLLTGTILVESTFALPGLGSLLVDAVTGKDVPLLQGVVLLLAVVIVVVNLAIDVLYTRVDPRIAYGRSAA